MEHCRHCADPDAARHQDPDAAKAEADCAFYEKPENQVPGGPGYRLRRHARPSLSLRYEPPEHGPRALTMAG
jgi:hypothetical protein